MGRVKTELIKIKVAIEGATVAISQLDSIAQARGEAEAAGTDAAKSSAAAGGAAKKAGQEAAGGARAAGDAAAAASKSAGNLRAALTGAAGAAGPLTLALGGAGSAAGAAGAAARGLGGALAAALGPLGILVTVAGGVIGSLISLRQAKEKDREEAERWAKEYKLRVAEVLEAQDQLYRERGKAIAQAESSSEVKQLETQIELLGLLGGSTADIAAAQEALQDARDAEIASAQTLLATETLIVTQAHDAARAELKRLEAARRTAQSYTDSTRRAEEVKIIDDQILVAQEGITAALGSQNAVREEGLSLAARQLDLDRQREIESAKVKRTAIDVVKAETTEAYTGFSGEVPIEALAGAREAVLAAGGSEADADEVQQNIIEGNVPKARTRGGGKAKKKEEKIEARFGDYRDVLKAYAESRAGVDAKALDSLAKGVMPKDHKPETSIQITNNNNYAFDSSIVIEGGERRGRAIAQDIAAYFQAEVARAIKQTPNGLVR